MEKAYRLCNSRRRAERYLGPDFRSPARPPDTRMFVSISSCRSISRIAIRPCRNRKSRISLPVSRTANLPRGQPVIGSRTVADIHQLFDGMIATGRSNDQNGSLARPANYSDEALANRFTARHRDDLRFVNTWAGGWSGMASDGYLTRR